MSNNQESTYKDVSGSEEWKPKSHQQKIEIIRSKGTQKKNRLPFFDKNINIVNFQQQILKHQFNSIEKILTKDKDEVDRREKLRAMKMSFAEKCLLSAEIEKLSSTFNFI